MVEIFPIKPMKKIYLVLMLAFLGIATNAQNYEWAKGFGGTYNAYGYSTAIDGVGISEWDL
jgi:hypothetical protein